jgi:CelD/BcsL family acetyltransferase involved in cellulose biosynthesis
MTLVTVFKPNDDLAELKQPWNQMVREDPAALLGMDGSSTIEWFLAIRAALNEARDAHVLVLGDLANPQGIFPVVRQSQNPLGARLALATEVNGGRNGLLVAEQDSQLLRDFFAALPSLFGNWLNFKCSLVADSPSEKLLLEACRGSGYRAVAGPSWESPYFPVCPDDDSFMSHVSKSLRQNMRTSLNKYRDLHVLHYKDYQKDGDPDELIDHVIRIERQSWKHEKGDAVSNSPRQERFYREIFRIGLPAGLVVSKVMFADDAPIAFNVGVIHQSVFSCLKHSNIESHDKFSPSYLLNLELIRSLRSMGIATYDYKGRPNPHKMRWSDQCKTYPRRTWMIYPPGLRGTLDVVMRNTRAKLAALAHRVGK